MQVWLHDRVALAGVVQRGAVGLQAGVGLRVVLGDLLRSPLGGLVGVALRAGVGGAQGGRLIRAWYAEAVIVAVVYPHKARDGHMAGDAAGALGIGGVQVVTGLRVVVGVVALAAHLITGQFQGQ